jgi:hypothetical protein
LRPHASRWVARKSCLFIAALPRGISPFRKEILIMNTTRYLFAAAFAVGIGVQMSSAYAATVVTYSSKPAYPVTTVYTTGPYWGIYPAPCCYTRVVVKGGASSATVAVVPPPKPPARVVVAPPPVAVYPAPRVVYAPAPYYPATYYYVP